MPRAERERTKYQGIYKRAIPGRGNVYDVKIGNAWLSKGKHTNLEAAKADRDQAVAELHTGGSLPTTSRTLRDFAERYWLPRQKARVEQGNLRASTLRNYRRDLNGHILTTFGETRLAAINVEAVQRFSDTLSASGKANFTVLRIVNTLSSILTLAKTYRLISFNPVDAIEKPPAKRRRDPHPLTLEDVRRLAEAAPTDDVRNLILVAAFTGARMGELFGLRWDNVKLDPGSETALIIEQVYQGEVVDRPKTLTGRRLIELAPHAAEAFRSQHIESKRPNPLGLVFPSADGNHQRQSNFTRREWVATRERAGLAQVTFHDLRHFFVSYIRNAGLPTSVTEQLVGHSDDRTHRGYTHALPGTEQIIRDGYIRAFGDLTA